MEQPETRYAQNGDLNIAYQVVGDGPLDLVFVPGLMSNIDLAWSLPAPVRFFRRLASFSRLILFDKRGQGVSDPVSEPPTLEDDMADLLAVLDTVGSKQAALVGYSEGGPMSALFAATYPGRTTALIAFGSFVDTGPRFDWGDAFERVDDAIDHWGEGRSLSIFAPSIATPERARQFGQFERAVGSPRLIRWRAETNRGIDVRPVLSSVQAPTLVLHRTGDVVPLEASRELAKRIPGARFVELPGQDHIPWVGDSEPILEQVEEFLTGARHAREPERVLATVLFTDIVGSTERAATLGDRRWRTVVEEHDDLIRHQLDRFDGREIKTMGDGFLATFDGPARGIRCGRSIADEIPALGIDVRAGLHTGECQLHGDDVAGMAVNIGARVGAKAAPGEVLVSSTVKDLVVGSGIEFEDRGSHALKGVPGDWRLYAVIDA
jgi:class 3 adenylate cyclase